MKVALLFIALAAFCFSALAQTSAPTESKTEKEKAQKALEKRVLEILDQAVGDAATLKLAQNRAVVYAIAGDLYWKFDEKRARELFRRCEGELIATNAESDKDKKENEDLYAGVFEFGTARSEILPFIAKHDADLALEMLVSTRPVKLTEAMAKAAQPNTRQEGGMFSFNPEQYRVNEEIALEQKFAVLAAE